ncbi:MAG: hypothetical protein K1W35_20025 [Lachnospiraceae bacterium]
MYYLVDTNVFLHDIDSNIYGVAEVCKDKGNDICITKTILDELNPGYYRESEDESSKEVYTCVTNLLEGRMGIKAIRLIQLDDIFGAREELKKIRDRYYSWMRNPDYLQKMIEKGTLTREDIKKENFKKKDMGECELVAIAKASGGEYWLITNDKGRVYKHPDMNIFDAYSKDKDVVILSGEEWIRNIGYLSEEPQK